MFKYGANVNSINDEKQTPLNLAIKNCNKVNVELLCKNGANVN